MKKLTAQEVLELPLEENDSEADTIRGYLKALLKTLWEEEEGFSSKRPFGNSGWKHDFDKSLIEAGAVKGELDEDGYVEDADDDAVDKIILQAIDAL